MTVSVIIPTYNRAQLLTQAIDCLLEQTRVPDEIIVVDDGSTDNTLEVLARYGPPVRVIQQENAGPGIARNRGIEAATGDLLAFLDSDDTLDPESIRKRAEYLENHPDTSIVYTGAYMRSLDGRVLSWFVKPPLPSGRLYAELICRHLFPIHAVMLRHTCFTTGARFDSLPGEDYGLWAQLSADYLIASIDQPLANYRVHPQMRTNASEFTVRNGIRIQERIQQMSAFRTLSPQQCARFYVVCGSRHAQLGETQQARAYFKRAIKIAPKQLRPYLLYMLSPLGKKSYLRLARIKGQLVTLTAGLKP